MSDALDVAQPGTPITPSERSALEAYTVHGSVKGVASALGKSPKTIEHQFATARVRLGVGTTVEVIRLVLIEAG